LFDILKRKTTMKRFHVHIAVASIEQSVNFYTKLFGQQPSIEQSDYAKWMLEDPRINFAISHRPDQQSMPGLSHLGMQVDSREELEQMANRIERAGLPLNALGDNNCCYSASAKGWAFDPQGIAWESFVTFGASTVYGQEQARPAQANASCSQVTDASSCCVPKRGDIAQSILQDVNKSVKACC
jgi:catechol 2,3-dioxygenase-like lactoylglutathione lyase family enzyme